MFEWAPQHPSIPHSRYRSRRQKKDQSKKKLIKWVTEWQGHLLTCQTLAWPGQLKASHTKTPWMNTKTPANTGKQLACLSTWWNTSLRQPDAVPISFLQGGHADDTMTTITMTNTTNAMLMKTTYTRAAEESHMIYNHRAYFSGQEDIDSGFTQVYLF